MAAAESTRSSRLRRDERPSATDSAIPIATAARPVCPLPRRGIDGYGLVHATSVTSASAATATYPRATHQSGASSASSRRSAVARSLLHHAAATRHARAPAPSARVDTAVSSSPAAERSSAANSSGGPSRGAIAPP